MAFKLITLKKTGQYAATAWLVSKNENDLLPTEHPELLKVESSEYELYELATLIALRHGGDAEQVFHNLKYHCCVRDVSIIDIQK